MRAPLVAVLNSTVGLLFLVACGGGGGGGTGGGDATGGGGAGGGINAPAPEVPVQGASDSFQGTTFVMPQGFTKSTATDGVLLTAPQAQSQGACFIAILPPEAAGADADAQAVTRLKAFFASSGFTELYDQYGGLDPSIDRARGVSGAGWSWVYVWGYLGAGMGQTDNKARILLAQLGATVVPVIGFEAGDNRCLDNDATGKPINWQLAYYSLQFASFTAASGPTLAQQLYGKWQVGGTSYFLGETWAANGRYGFASAYATYSQTAANEITQTTTTYLGDGAFQVKGDQLTIAPDNGSGPKTYLFRITQEANSAAPGGFLPVLRRLQLGTDNVPYETSITRDTSG